ncbi:unnamed protein product [Owenia fusiformis]|uniref:Maltase n=1 Tax=Owenia fusiformis TaxID=6347 RepID=A0A8J1U9W3_OWEFU|nr:unnamed protein product [Owenia fusiformis]
MVSMRILSTFAVISAFLFLDCEVESCQTTISDSNRRDCSPWSGTNQASCEARGCIWCPHETSGIPWCFFNDHVCPSLIADGEKVDCHPESGASRESCNNRGCIWCETSTPNTPYCFSDPTVSQGGANCPSDISDHERIDCHPDSGSTEDSCIKRGCHWCTSSIQDVPWCFAPKTTGYTLVGDVTQTAKGYTATLDRKPTSSWYGHDIARIQMDVEFQTNSRLRIKIFDPSVARFEVPLNISSTSAALDPLYSVEFSNSPAFNIKVKRASNGATLFDTSLGGLVFSEQFLQFATKLNSHNVYGFGEHEHHSLKHDMNWKSWGMYARDQPVTHGANLYGVHPFYMNVETSNLAHGVLVLNSNAQDVTLSPLPSLKYRTIGGILDIYMFLGPSPENVVQQYTQAIGRPVMPPYWALGFHLSRYGYNDIQTLKDTVNRMRAFNIPHDVQHGDIDMMDRRLDFTYDPVNFTGLPQYVRDLKNEGTRWISIQDPCISIGEPAGTYRPFDLGQSMDVWVKESDGVTNAEGRVWPDANVYFPDYSSTSCQSWWKQMSIEFHSTIEYDGMWIDMNEPASFVTGSVKGCYYNQWNNPLYKPRVYGDVLADKTLCGDYLQSFGSHYNTHNLFGWSQSPVTQEAVQEVTGKRSIVLSRSTFPGSGSTSVHWLGDNHSLWSNLHYSIIGSLEFNLFGIPFVGPDICGFGGHTTEEMCQRWMQLGAFYPFSRNHNGLGWREQDPGILGAEVARVSRESLEIRYTILPYMYTLFHHAHIDGSTVMRPLFHEFVTDTATHAIDRQFLLGPAFLVSAVLNEGKTSVSAYIPDARWYDWYTGAEVSNSLRKSWTTLPAPLDFIPLHVRGGYILPTQQPANSTMFSRLNNLGLIVALDDNEEASGDLFWDEGDTKDSFENGEFDTVEYTAVPGILTGITSNLGYAGLFGMEYETVRVMGLAHYLDITDVRVNNQQHNLFTFTSSTGVLDIVNLTLPAHEDFSITWTAL